jgi:hypothetical protein
VAVNTLSSVLGRGAAALQQATELAASVFHVESGAGVGVILQAVHTICDVAAARVVLSYARSGRVQAALVAREALLADGMGAPGSGSAAAAARASARYGPTLGTPATGRWLAAVDDEDDAAPLAAPPDAVTTCVFDSSDYTDPAVYDAFLDETALLMQRCASYLRIILSRAAAADASAAGAASHGAQASPTGAAGVAALSPPSCEAAIRAAHRLQDAAAELGGKYSVLEQAHIQSGVSKAVAIDEVLEEGVAGTSVDPAALAAVVGAGARGGSSGAPDLASPQASAAMGDGSTDTAAAGAGAMCSTLVEDCFYVFQAASRRAFATGSADGAAAVVNHVVFALQERLCRELEARLAFALAEAADIAAATATGGGSGTLAVRGGLVSIPLCRQRPCTLLVSFVCARFIPRALGAPLMRRLAHGFPLPRSLRRCPCRQPKRSAWPSYAALFWGRRPSRTPPGPLPSSKR